MPDAGDIKIEMKDYKKEMESKLKTNMGAALVSMGEIGLEMILDVMKKKYGRPIYLSGDLMRSMTFVTDTWKQSVTWGTNLNYGPAVHEGMRGMTKRPFLKDGIIDNKDKLRDVVAQELKKGF